jgi:hypothetical protein
MSHDIFISYSRRDSLVMGQVRDMLRESGFTVWTDEGIEPGSASWKLALSNAIIECSTVVVLFSPDAAKSTWVNRELDFAELHRKKIFPLLVRGEVQESLPFGYTTFQFIDIRLEDSRSENLQRLVSTLQGDFPNRQFSVSMHPRALEPLNSMSEDAYKPVEAGNQTKQAEETLWKALETAELRMFVPSTWKISEANHENWARANLLMLKDEDAFYQFLQDEQKVMSLMTGFSWSHFERYKIVSDISDLEPISGFMAFANLPLVGSNVPIITRLFENFFLHRSNKYFKQYLNLEITNSYWLPYAHGRILVYELEGMAKNIGYRSCSYNFVPFLGRRIFMINFSTQAARYEQEKEDYERMARSVQFIRK